MPRESRESIETQLLRLWAWPLWRLLRKAGQREVARRDAERFAFCSGLHHLDDLDELSRFAWCLARWPEFRSLMHYRLKALPLPVRLLLKWIWRPEPTLYLYCDSIGPGLFIQHGFATTITAKAVGEDCWVNQQVTIGWGAKGRGGPTLGDRVRVGAGAMVLGAINVGNDAVVAANATVVDDLPASSTAVGPKARVIPPKAVS